MLGCSLKSVMETFAAQTLTDHIGIQKVAKVRGKNDEFVSVMVGSVATPHRSFHRAAFSRF